ncbi:hypothetical protein QQS21_008577 [Conoideocrella luteorostrata]|uniref:Uncharacterized protein n=1 Tax=Conoideocrella luteorostrata TaxID=1105319 RepID=A0AAJ0FRA7_9HYPO|nr:hypothetical protein QQS21_008577 [Conoideocrella luteorostrata]
MDDYMNDPRFNRIFTLPPDPAKNRTSSFRVKYADYGYRNEVHPHEENVLLFFGPLMASRLLHISKDAVAKKHKIRIINPDRPGIGGTDAVGVENRMSFWREVVMALLESLGIQNVSVYCHSGGTVYALDMLLHHPEILHPEKPYLAIGAPWILPSHTSATTMSIIQTLPASILGDYDKFAKFTNNSTLGFSVNSSVGLVGKLMPTTHKASNKVVDREDVAFEENLWPKIIDRIHAESVQGFSSDAVLFMQKVPGSSGWSSWGDVDVLVPRLGAALSAAGKRLRVDVFYAERDFMIGKGCSKGPLWFDHCWLQCNRDVIDYHSKTIAGADHNRIWNLRWGVMDEVFARIGKPVGEIL